MKIKEGKQDKEGAYLIVQDVGSPGRTQLYVCSSSCFDLTHTHKEEKYGYN